MDTIYRNNNMKPRNLINKGRPPFWYIHYIFLFKGIELFNIWPRQTTAYFFYCLNRKFGWKKTFKQKFFLGQEYASVVELSPNRSHTQNYLTVEGNYSIPNTGKSPVFQVNLGNAGSVGSEVGLQEDLWPLSEAWAPGQWDAAQTLAQTGSGLVTLTTLLASLGSVSLVPQSKTCIQVKPLPSVPLKMCSLFTITLSPLLTV